MGLSHGYNTAWMSGLGWCRASHTPDDLLFPVKLNRTITHEKQLDTARRRMCKHVAALLLSLLPGKGRLLLDLIKAQKWDFRPYTG